MFKKIAVGAGALFGSDLAVMYAPASIDFSGLPVRKAAGAFVGCYAASAAVGSSRTLMTVAVKALGALVAAELASAVGVPSVAVGPVDLARLGAGALGGWAADKIF